MEPLENTSLHPNRLTRSIRLLLFLAFFVAGLVVGSRAEIFTPSQETLRLPIELSQAIDEARFIEVWKTIKTSSYEPVTDTELFEGVLRGIAEATKDPYTTFFSKEESDLFLADLEGTFTGIGAQLGRENGFLQIVAPLPGTPAERSGVKAGDAILSIDEKAASEMSVEEAVFLIRGERGTAVTLRLARQGVAEPISVVIVRDLIEVDSVEVMFDADTKTLELTITSFDADAARLVEQALATHTPERILVDLRGNPGGLLESAVDIAAFWVGEKTVVLQEDAKKTRHALARPRTQPIVPEQTKTVVLIDGGSASASEILAGALKDHGRAKIVGTQSFGKGSVQELIELPDGSALKITVAHWLTPFGNTIHETGITPDTEIPAVSSSTSHDTQKETALEILRAT